MISQKQRFNKKIKVNEGIKANLRIQKRALNAAKSVKRKRNNGHSNWVSRANYDSNY